MGVLVDLEFLSRVLRIGYGSHVGSAVCVQIGGLNFLLTAYHLTTGMKAGDNLAIRFQGRWQLERVLGVSPCALGADVCAIRLGRDLGDGLQEDRLDGSVHLGEDVAYCGFPLNLEIEGVPGALGWPTGFVKSAVLSGGVSTPWGLELYFDTINNVGFSGGPVIRKTHDGLKIVALVSNYRFDADAPVYEKGRDGRYTATADYVVRPNSGFMRAVPIARAVAAAKALATQ